MYKSFLVRLFAVLSYCLLGAAVFYSIENLNNDEDYYRPKNENVTFFIKNFTTRLHDNVSSAALRRLSQELQNFVVTMGNTDRIQEKGQFDRYITWVYFCFTTIMTIGYGDITPKTSAGKLILVFYCGIGIPLMVWLLACTGQIQTFFLNKLVRKVQSLRCSKRRSSDICVNNECLVFLLSVLALVPNAFLGTLVVWFRTRWSVIDCVYFWFCTVTTIGFGDLTVNNSKAAYLLPWMLTKIVSISVVAGAVNSMSVWLLRRKPPKLRRFREKVRINEEKCVTVKEMDDI